MKILLLSHVKDNPDGGASRVYHMLGSALRERGHAVDLYHQEAFGLPRTRKLALAAERFLLPKYVSRFASRLALHNYDIVMASSGMAAPLFRRLSNARNRPALINQLHGLAIYDHIASMTEHTLGHWPTSRLYRMVTGPFQMRWDAAGIASADLTITLCLRDMSWVRQQLPQGRDALRIAGAVHPELLMASQWAVAMAERQPDRILWFGTWESRKGAFYLPMVFRQVRERRPSATLVVGGSGRAPGELLKLFDERDRAHVEVLPRISRAEQIRQFNSASIFLFPSQSEGFGLALLEAMCFGLACVTTNTAFGGDELIDRVNARVVFPSVEHIARAVIELTEDASLRSAIALHGRELARGFTLERMTDAFEKAFLQLGKQSPPN